VRLAVDGPASQGGAGAPGLERVQLETVQFGKLTVCVRRRVTQKVASEGPDTDSPAAQWHKRSDPHPKHFIISTLEVLRFLVPLAWDGARRAYFYSRTACKPHKVT
jgi:hypothetical protein